MKMKNVFILVIGLSLFSASCGSSDPADGTAGGGSPGGIGAPLPPGAIVDFSTYCFQRGGSVVIEAGQQICKIVSIVPTMQQSFANYRLNSSTPTNGFQTGIYAQAGDRVHFQGSGGWNGITGSGFVFCSSFSSLNHDVADSDGLVMSTGTAASIQLIGNGVAKTVSQPGWLTYGFNIPSQYTFTCFMLSVQQFWHYHCENTAGQTVACQ